MELIISKRDFMRGLGRAHSVADRKSSMAILSNVLLVADKSGFLKLAATDLYLGVAAKVEAKVSEPGDVAVSARTLFDIVRNLPEGDVHWKVGDKKAAELRCGKVRYRIPGMAADDFPPLPNPGKAAFVTLDAQVVGELIGTTQYSMSSDDTRPHLAGALFEGEGNTVRMVTTDGHRLSKAERRLEGQDSLKFSMLVPNKGIQELRRLIEDKGSDKSKESDAATEQGVSVAHVGGNAFFKRDGVQLSVKLADENFPPYKKVIPQQQNRRLCVSRTAFVESLKRISVVASDKSGGVRLQIDPGKLLITSENPDVGEGSEELDVDFAGDPLTTGFNARYLLDVLTAQNDDQVLLELSGELDPAVIRPASDPDAFVGVIMPMRI